MRILYYLLLMLTIAFVTVLSVNLRAQIIGPFYEGDQIKRQINVSCIPTKQFVAVARSKGMRLVAVDFTSDIATKMLYVNGSGELAVVNTLPDGTVCFMDIFNPNSYFSEEFKIIREKDENKSPPQQQND